VPEIVRDGETGWLGETEDQMVEEVKRAGTLERRRCRAGFENEFTVGTMTDRYLDVYATLTRARNVAASLPALLRAGAGAVPGPHSDVF
jgi:glycosyltransferase involved in cell wall biosynthesis